MCHFGTHDIAGIFVITTCLQLNLVKFSLISFNLFEFYLHAYMHFILMTLYSFSRHMDPHIKDLKRRQDHNWKRHLVDSFETSLKDPPVSRNVEKYTVPETDPIEALRGQLGLRTVGASDVFVVGVYRSRTMLELPTYTEQERCVVDALLSVCTAVTAFTLLCLSYPPTQSKKGA